MTTIAIIGSGLSGLTVANKLRDYATITLFEKSRGVGGRESKGSDSIDFPVQIDITFRLCLLRGLTWQGYQGLSSRENLSTSFWGEIIEIRSSMRMRIISFFATNFVMHRKSINVLFMPMYLWPTMSICWWRPHWGRVSQKWCKCSGGIMFSILTIPTSEQVLYGRDVIKRVWLIRSITYCYVCVI